MSVRVIASCHPTTLQRRLAEEVRHGLARSGQSQADLSRATGIGAPHISLLLRGQRAGTLAAWDRLIAAAHRGVGSPQLRLAPGAASSPPLPPTPLPQPDPPRPPLARGHVAPVSVLRPVSKNFR